MVLQVDLGHPEPDLDYSWTGGLGAVSLAQGELWKLISWEVISRQPTLLPRFLFWISSRLRFMDAEPSANIEWTLEYILLTFVKISRKCRQRNQFRKLPWPSLTSLRLGLAEFVNFREKLTKIRIFNMNAYNEGKVSRWLVKCCSHSSYTLRTFEKVKIYSSDL